MRLPLALLLLTVPALAQKTGDVVVATKQTQLKTATFLYKLPVEAQRGERWEITKYSKGKVTLTFGPKDDRRTMMASIGKRPEYELSGKDFASSFVLEAEWPAKRLALATTMQLTFSVLSVEQCERILEGEVWIGMLSHHAAEAVGNRVLKKESSETADGKTERWQVGAFSMMTTAEKTAKSYVYQDALTASASRPQEPLEVKASRDMDSSVRMILTFKNGALAEIVRR